MSYVHIKNLTKPHKRKKRMRILLLICFFVVCVVLGIIFYQKSTEPIKSEAVTTVLQFGDMQFDFHKIFGNTRGVALKPKREGLASGESWLYEDGEQTYHRISVHGLEPLDESHEYRTWLSDAEGNFIQTSVLTSSSDSHYEMQYSTRKYIGIKQKVTISRENKKYKGDHPTDIVLEGVHAAIQAP